MDQFLHIRIIIGMVLGLGITLLLRGLSKFIQHPKRYKIYGVHIAWALYVFIMLTHFWWWEFHLTTVQEWTFVHYFFVILYTVSYFLLSAILFPDDINDFSGYEDYFNSSRKWFFGLLIASLLIDIGDSQLKGADYIARLGVEYFLRTGLLIALALISIWVHSKRFQTIVVTVFIVYEIVWAYRMYLTL